MEDPFEFLLYMIRMQQQQQQAASSIVDTITFWIVLAVVAPVLVKFLMTYFALRRFLGSDEYYKPSPLGVFGVLLGAPPVPKSAEELRSDREHAYRRWGTGLCASCLVGGIVLFLMGITGNTDVQITSIAVIKNAAPGTILFVVGFLIWRQVHK